MKDTSPVPDRTINIVIPSQHWAASIRMTSVSRIIVALLCDRLLAQGNFSFPGGNAAFSLFVKCRSGADVISFQALSIFRPRSTRVWAVVPSRPQAILTKLNRYKHSFAIQPTAFLQAFPKATRKLRLEAVVCHPQNFHPVPYNCSFIKNVNPRQIYDKGTRGSPGGKAKINIFMKDGIFSMQK